MWLNIYLIEWYPYPHYHCNGNCRSQLFPRLDHRLASLRLFLSACHLQKKYLTLSRVEFSNWGKNGATCCSFPLAFPLSTVHSTTFFSFCRLVLFSFPLLPCSFLCFHKSSNDFDLIFARVCTYFLSVGALIHICHVIE